MDYSSELQQLHAEGELPLNDLIALLPSEILELPPVGGEDREEKDRDGGEGKEGAVQQEETPTKRKTR